MRTLDTIDVLLFQKDITFETLKVISIMKSNLYIGGGGSGEVDRCVSFRFRIYSRIHSHTAMAPKGASCATTVVDRRFSPDINDFYKHSYQARSADQQLW